MLVLGFGLICILGQICLAGGTTSALKPGDFVAVCGDSITFQRLYSVFIEDYFIMCQPAKSLRVLQVGKGGEVAQGFLGWMKQKVLSFHPTAATTCFGMNDGGYVAFDPAHAALYRTSQKEIVQTFKKSGVRLIVLGSPGCVDSFTYRNSPEQAVIYNKTLGQFKEIDRQIAKEEGIAFANVHDLMMEVMAKAKAKYGKTYPLAADGVHPGPNGHLVMAYAFLKALGCDGDIGTITLDLASGKANTTAGHKIISTDNVSVTVESSRYPFCFFGDPKSPDATRGVIEFFPFNREMNRFLLVVKGADPHAKYKMTWGKFSKDFSGVELSNGINLADEFLDNPFCESFRKVEQAIQDKQKREAKLMKVLLNAIPAFREYLLPEDTTILDQLLAKLIKRDTIMADTVSKSVVPLRHTICLERTDKK